MILLSKTVLDGRPDQRSFGVLDIAVRRNAFGRQVDSFEADLDVRSIGVVPAVFIRAPYVERVDDDVEVLARVDDHPVLCRQGHVLAAAFHPELSGDLRLHEYFLREVR
jgi:5'-phosphate synthase pdxT subunit